MENPTSDSLSATLGNSIQALGRGFDVTSDIRLLYCKGAPGSRLVHVDEDHTKNLLLSHDLVIPNVSMDVDWSPGKDGIETTPVYSFHEVMMILFIPFSSTPFVSRFFFLAWFFEEIQGNGWKSIWGRKNFQFFFVFFLLCCCFYLLGELACDFNVLDLDCIF